MISTICAPGYFGPNCTLTCPKNTYGDNCGGICEPICFARDCHHVYGCPQNTGVLIQPTNRGKLMSTISLFIKVCRKTGFTIKNFNLLNCLHITGLHSKITRTVVSAKNTLKTTTGVERLTPKSEFNLSYLLAGIGVIVLIVICITHLYQTVRIRRKLNPSNIHTFNEKNEINQPMETIYNEIGHSVELSCSH